MHVQPLSSSLQPDLFHRVGMGINYTLDVVYIIIIIAGKKSRAQYSPSFTTFSLYPNLLQQTIYMNGFYICKCIFSLCLPFCSVLNINFWECLRSAKQMEGEAFERPEIWSTGCIPLVSICKGIVIIKYPSLFVNKIAIEDLLGFFR